MQVATRGTVSLQTMFIISSACLLKTFMFGKEGERGRNQREKGEDLVTSSQHSQPCGWPSETDITR